MLTSVKPWRANHWLSARVENRGPWITTMVPPSTTPGRPAAAARSSGQYGSAKLTWMPPGVEVRRRPAAGAVDQLIGHHHRTGTQVRREAADRARPEDAPHAQRPQRPHVGAVGHGVRRELVLDAVAGQERHLVIADGADGDRCARGAVRGVEADAARIGAEERVEAATTDDSEHPTILADGALAARFQVPVFSSRHGCIGRARRRSAGRGGRGRCRRDDRRRPDGRVAVRPRRRLDRRRGRLPGVDLAAGRPDGRRGHRAARHQSRRRRLDTADGRTDRGAGQSREPGRGGLPAGGRIHAGPRRRVGRGRDPRRRRVLGDGAHGVHAALCPAVLPRQGDRLPSEGHRTDIRATSRTWPSPSE